ncbi:hypothetical protein [Coralliovum pocilloporae]|uniref:hypothetical protein n=1 Tax=Coralliovum pocilloporae TaxID=3066369 RepID=UPI003306E128
MEKREIPKEIAKNAVAVYAYNVSQQAIAHWLKAGRPYDAFYPTLNSEKDRERPFSKSWLLLGQLPNLQPQVEYMVCGGNQKPILELNHEDKPSATVVDTALRLTSQPEVEVMFSRQLCWTSENASQIVNAIMLSIYAEVIFGARYDCMLSHFSQTRMLKFDDLKPKHFRRMRKRLLKIIDEDSYKFLVFTGSNSMKDFKLHYYENPILVPIIGNCSVYWSAHSRWERNNMLKSLTGFFRRIFKRDIDEVSESEYEFENLSEAAVADAETLTVASALSSACMFAWLTDHDFARTGPQEGMNKIVIRRRTPEHSGSEVVHLEGLKSSQRQEHMNAVSQLASNAGVERFPVADISIIKKILLNLRQEYGEEGAKRFIEIAFQCFRDATHDITDPENQRAVFLGDVRTYLDVSKAVQSGRPFEIEHFCLPYTVQYDENGPTIRHHTGAGLTPTNLGQSGRQKAL